jgi:hypothetical protein
MLIRHSCADLFSKASELEFSNEDDEIKRDIWIRDDRREIFQAEDSPNAQLRVRSTT